MKVWIGYGSEHSANLVIIGKFASGKKANAALALLNEATRIAREDEAAGRLKAGELTTKFTDAQMKLCEKTNFSVNFGDPEQLLYDFDSKVEADKVVITTDEMEINVFLKILIHEGAKVEVYSAHEHVGQYGRQTKE
jgi:hypothetical protein